MLNCKVNGSPVRKTRRNGEVDRLTSVAGGAVAFVKLGLSCSSPLTGIGVEVEVATLSGVGKGVSDINASEERTLPKVDSAPQCLGRAMLLLLDALPWQRPQALVLCEQVVGDRLASIQ